MLTSITGEPLGPRAQDVTAVIQWTIKGLFLSSICVFDIWQFWKNLVRIVGSNSTCAKNISRGEKTQTPPMVSL